MNEILSEIYYYVNIPLYRPEGTVLRFITRAKEEIRACLEIVEEIGESLQ